MISEVSYYTRKETKQYFLFVNNEGRFIGQWTHVTMFLAFEESLGAL